MHARLLGSLEYVYISLDLTKKEQFNLILSRTNNRTSWFHEIFLKWQKDSCFSTQWKNISNDTFRLIKLKMKYHGSLASILQSLKWLLACSAINLHHLLFDILNDWRTKFAIISYLWKAVNLNLEIQTRYWLEGDWHFRIFSEQT